MMTQVLVPQQLFNNVSAVKYNSTSAMIEGLVSTQGELLIFSTPIILSTEIQVNDTSTSSKIVHIQTYINVE